jgi:serine/threonine-protein kinase
MDEIGGGDPRLKGIVRKMCEPEPRRRIGGFTAVKLLLDQADLSEPEFAEEDVGTYRCFADELVGGLAKIDVKCTNVTDVAQVIARLEALYKSSMLERAVGVNRVARCFLAGTFHHFREQDVTVSYLRAFLKLLKRSDVEPQRIILANLFARLDAVKRFDDDEIPF